MAWASCPCRKPQSFQRRQTRARCPRHFFNGLLGTRGYGSAGTLAYNFADDTIFAGKLGGSDLAPVPIPPDKVGGWRVEADFIDAIRLGKPVVFRDCSIMGALCFSPEGT